MADTEGIRSNPNGTVSIVTPEQTITIRRPTLREYADFVDHRVEVDEHTYEAGQELTELINKKAPLSERNAILRRITDRNRESLDRLVSTFGDPPVAQDDWTIWMYAHPGEIIGKVLDIWETIPSDGSGQNES